MTLCGRFRSYLFTLRGEGVRSAFVVVQLSEGLSFNRRNMFVSKKRFHEVCREASSLAIENYKLEVKLARIQKQLNDYTENMNKIIGKK